MLISRKAILKRKGKKTAHTDIQIKLSVGNQTAASSLQRKFDFSTVREYCRTFSLSLPLQQDEESQIHDFFIQTSVIFKGRASQRV